MRADHYNILDDFEDIHITVCIIGIMKELHATHQAYLLHQMAWRAIVDHNSQYCGIRTQPSIM